MSKVPEQVWRDSPVKLWIVHKDGTKNNTLVVYPWKDQKQRNRKFALNKRLLDNYQGAPIKEVRFYDKSFTSSELMGYRDEHGVYHGGVAFVNSLRY